MAGFRPLGETSVRWRSLAGVGLEPLTVCAEGGAIHAAGVIIGAHEGTPFGVSYTLTCDAAWTARSLDLRTTARQHLHLESDGHGHWHDGEGRPMPALGGCIDIDLAGTPFTNTLPIRRLALGPETGAVDLDMAYVPFDSFSPVRHAQRYRCLEEDYLFRYENADGGFSADLTVDEDGLVIDYPTLFERIEPAMVFP